MTQDKVSNRPGTKAWRETLAEEAQEETQVVEEEEDDLHPHKDHP